MAKKDIILAKVSIVRNCLNTIHRVTGADPEKLDDLIIQDVFVLNLERSIQACIDSAHAVIAVKGLMMPSSYKQAFHILSTNNIIKTETAEKMKKMVGFRNIAVHDYQKLNLDILKSILKSHLGDLEDYCKEILAIKL